MEVIASRTGLPVSITHILVIPVLGVGIARGMDALNLRGVIDTFTSWLIILPVGAIMSMLFFFVVKCIIS